jgi:Family of unknown function (DUF5946)
MEAAAAQLDVIPPRVPKETLKSPTRCEECGARYRVAADPCQDRLDQLLALDHSRREPWGGRHGLAFAAFALQHPRRYPAASVASARELIHRVAVNGESLA